MAEVQYRQKTQPFRHALAQAFSPAKVPPEPWQVHASQQGRYGGPIITANLDGLGFNTPHITARCSPSRFCRLHGPNHHANGLGTSASAQWRAQRAVAAQGRLENSGADRCQTPEPLALNDLVVAAPTGMVVGAGCPEV